MSADILTQMRSSFDPHINWYRAARRLRDWRESRCFKEEKISTAIAKHLQLQGPTDIYGFGSNDFVEEFLNFHQHISLWKPTPLSASQVTASAVLKQAAELVANDISESVGLIVHIINFELRIWLFSRRGCMSGYIVYRAHALQHIDSQMSKTMLCSNVAQDRMAFTVKYKTKYDDTCGPSFSWDLDDMESLYERENRTRVVTRTLHIWNMLTGQVEHTMQLNNSPPHPTPYLTQNLDYPRSRIMSPAPKWAFYDKLTILNGVLLATQGTPFGCNVYVWKLSTFEQIFSWESKKDGSSPFITDARLVSLSFAQEPNRLVLIDDRASFRFYKLDDSTCISTLYPYDGNSTKADMNIRFDWDMAYISTTDANGRHCTTVDMIGMQVLNNTPLEEGDNATGTSMSRTQSDPKLTIKQYHPSCLSHREGSLLIFCAHDSSSDTLHVVDLDIGAQQQEDMRYTLHDVFPGDHVWCRSSSSAPWWPYIVHKVQEMAPGEEFDLAQLKPKKKSTKKPAKKKKKKKTKNAIRGTRDASNEEKDANIEAEVADASMTGNDSIPSINLVQAAPIYTSKALPPDEHMSNQAACPVNHKLLVEKVSSEVPNTEVPFWIIDDPFLVRRFMSGIKFRDKPMDVPMSSVQENEHPVTQTMNTIHKRNTAKFSACLSSTWEMELQKKFSLRISASPNGGQRQNGATNE